VDTIRLLLAHGANIESATDKGLTPLFFALKSDEPQAAQVLAEAGANLYQVAGDGTTLFQMAMYQGSYEFAKMMITQGKADLAAFDRNGNQPLHAAVLAQQPELVSLLIRREANVHTPTGPSQVTWRYEGNFKDAVQYVAKPKSPIDLAEELKHAEIMQLLLDAGAVPTPGGPEKKAASSTVD
jgi:ankyrin repeat protein